MRPGSEPSPPPGGRMAGLRRGIAWSACLLAGCGPSEADRARGEPSPALPAAIASLIPTGAEVAHYESFGEPTPYRLWLLSGPGDGLMSVPEGSRGFEQHELPGAVLQRLLEAKAPRLEPGSPGGGTCRFSHWTDGDAEYRVREFVTDRGWFASIEQFRTPDNGG